MKTVLNWLALGIVVYFACWCVSYLWLVGTDFSHFWEYLVLAWTDPGELPGYLQFVSVVATVLITPGFAWWIRRRSRRV